MVNTANKLIIGQYNMQHCNYNVLCWPEETDYDIRVLTYWIIQGGGREKFVSDDSNNIRTSQGDRVVNIQFSPWERYMDIFWNGPLCVCFLHLCIYVYVLSDKLTVLCPSYSRILHFE